MVSSPRSPSRGRSRTRSETPAAGIREPSPSRSHTISPTGSRQRPSSRSRSRSRSRRSSRSPLAENGYRNGRRTVSRSLTRSRSPGVDGGARQYRERSYSRSISRERGPKQSSKIVVEKLTKNVTDAHLREIFGSYGEIESLELPINRQFMTNRGTAYILYASPSASESAIAHMHEGQIDGAVINADLPHYPLAAVHPLVAHRAIDTDHHHPEEEDMEDEVDEKTTSMCRVMLIQDRDRALHHRGGGNDRTAIQDHLRGRHLVDEVHQRGARQGEEEGAQATVLIVAIAGAGAGLRVGREAEEDMGGDDMVVYELDWPSVYEYSTFPFNIAR